jgi:hypothetical protein
MMTLHMITACILATPGVTLLMLQTLTLFLEDWSGDSYDYR